MRLRTSVLILIVALLVTATIGFIGMTKGRTLKNQNGTHDADKICDPMTCGPGGYDHPADCTCQYSVLLIDLSGKGIELTNVPNGVDFDLDGDGHAERVAWTQPNTGVAILFLDRNGDHVVNNGIELFGNFTSQLPATPPPNGFLGLVYSNRIMLGPKDDAVLNSQHALFAQLRIWQDVNHNGISEPGELHTLKEAGIEEISLDFKEFKHRDGYGNLFRFEANVYGASHQKNGAIYDVVFLPPR